MHAEFLQDIKIIMENLPTCICHSLNFATNCECRDWYCSMFENGLNLNVSPKFSRPYVQEVINCKQRLSISCTTTSTIQCSIIMMYLCCYSKGQSDEKKDLRTHTAASSHLLPKTLISKPSILFSFSFV